MRMAGEAFARQAGIENGALAAGAAELQGAGETGKAAADDDDVIHGDKLLVVDGGDWVGSGAQYRLSDTHARQAAIKASGSASNSPMTMLQTGRCRIRLIFDTSFIHLSS